MLLAIDSATRMLGLALHDGSRVLSESLWFSELHHTPELAPEIALAMRRASIGPKALTGIAVAQGPGSYTGLRIGMALAKGLSLVHGLQLIGVPTLDVLASAQPSFDGPMVGVLRAGRGRVAAVWYKWGRKGWTARKGAQNLSWEELREGLSEATYICGEISESERKSLRKEANVVLAPASLCVRRPSILAELAWQKIKRGKLESPAELAPTYLDPIAA